MGLGVEVDRVDIGHEPALDVRGGVVAQCLVGHGRAQVGPSDTDVDHRGDPLAGLPGPLAGPDAVGHLPHPVEHPVHVGYHVLPVDLERGTTRHAQRHVQHGTVLGGVDVAAREHGIPPLFDPGTAGHRHQASQGVVGDPVLRVVEREIPGRHRHPRTPPRVAGEELAQVHPTDHLEVVGQPLPLLGAGYVHDITVEIHGPSIPFRRRGRRRGTNDLRQDAPGRGRRLPIDHLPVTWRSLFVHLPSVG